MKNNLIITQIKLPKQRRVWGFNPITRVKVSKKIYSRKSKKLKMWKFFDMERGRPRPQQPKE